MPNRAIVNKLRVSEVPHELRKLNNLEKHLIALQLPFMKIVNLTSGKISSRLAQKGTKGPLHCVPSNVQDTVFSLPRPVDKSMMIRLQLKRRLKYKSVWEEQFINPSDVRDALLVLIRHHPAYKNIVINDITENYLGSDKEIDDMEFHEADIDLMDIDTINKEEVNNEQILQTLALGDIDNKCDYYNDDEQIYEDDKDIRAKYNIGTDSCIQPCDFNDFLAYDKQPFVVAPAEKNKLSSLLSDHTIEALAFPHLFPDGRGSYDEVRENNITWKEYCKIRLFSSDNRFASDSSYIFFLQYLSDLKQVFSGINVAFRKKLPITAKQSLDDTQMKFLMNEDMIYRHLQTVRGSPRYWHQRLKDLFGMTRQLGFPTFFVTLSCADLRWKEFIDTFARFTGSNIKESYTYEEKSKLLRMNPVLAARLFEKRFATFMNLFIKGGAWCVGKVKDWFVRIEMQMRGSPHAHMPLWVDKAPNYVGPSTDEKTRQEIIQFCDKYITTRFPSMNEDAELHNIINEVQTHSRSHSKSCLKYHKTICRFGFPRPVARHTFICEPIKVNMDDDEEKQKAKRLKEILSKINVAMNALEKEKALSWSDFDNLLQKYNWTYNDYEYALRVVHKRTTIIHKREPNARWVNQYNEELLRAWDANMDIQYVLDPYACAKYLMSYTTKPEREMSLLLEETHKECREGNLSVREEMKKLTGTFFNHRQVSVQEAIYRATKMPLTYSSRGFVFVPAHSNSCRFLKPHNVLKQMNPEDDNIYMSNIADKYFDRPIDNEFDICMAEFASEYEIISVKKNVKNPKTKVKRLRTLDFAVKKRCNRCAVIRYPYFNRETHTEDYYETLLTLYLPIRSRNDLKQPYELFYHMGEIFDKKQNCIRKIKDIVYENQKKYEAHFKETDEMIAVFNSSSIDMKENEWAEIVANKERSANWLRNMESEDNPDFNIIHKKKSKINFIDLKQSFISTDQIRPLLESMNEEQQEIFYSVREWCIKRLYNPDIEPIRLFITGGAGTGKSHLLKCLHYEATKVFSRKKHLEPDENIDEIHTLITAFTGAAAVNVGGVTIHNAFGISTHSNTINDHLSCDKLNSYRCKLSSLKLLFVDEVSLIQANLWGIMHSRLTQIMGIHSNDVIFGNIGIIAIGDFYQCSPVASASIYSSLLWSDHFKYIELKINERQKEDISFSQMLNRIRVLKKKDKMIEEDRSILEKCHQRYLKKEYNVETLHLFAKNDDVDRHNNDMIEKICSNIRTLHEVDRNNREIKENESKHKKKMYKPLKLARNARVMITKNLCVNDGIANGVRGRVIDFIEDNNKQICRVLIECDSLTAGRFHRVTCQYCRGKNTICVGRESDAINEQDFDVSFKKEVKQFPLRLSWAMTVHKAQGITVDEVVISTKNLFGSGMGYTALSRVRSFDGLFISDLHFDKFYCNQRIDHVLSRMKPLERKELILQDSSEFINILFHNIEGLNCHFKAFKNHYLIQKADLICLAETWLNETNDINNLQLNEFNFLHKTRSCSFQSNHLLYSQKRGGVAIYWRKSISIKNIDSLESLNLEHITYEIEKYKITIINCYRSPQQNKNEFLMNLVQHLNHIGINKHILIIGDLNEDCFNDESKPIQAKLESLGFVNIFKDLPTTNSLTSLDCIYCNFSFNQNEYRQTTGTFYSFHDLLILCMNIKTNINESNHDSEFNNKNEMNTNRSSSVELPIDVIPKISNKRKRDVEEENVNKSLCKDRVTSFTDACNNRLREKQLLFLSSYHHTNRMRRSNREIVFDSLTLEQQLNNNHLKIVSILGDGNCFFRAISHQLYRNQKKHLNIRHASMDYIMQHKYELENFIDMDLTIDDYIKRMSQNGTYADHIVVLATAVVINKNIIVHERGKKPLLIPGSDFIEHQLHVYYNPNILHYNSILSLSNTIPILSSEQVQLT